MKGKTLVRIGAALTALSMLGTMSTFAAEVINFDVNYNETDNSLSLSNITGASTGDSTFLVYDLTAAVAALSNENAPAYVDEEIYYVNQLKLEGDSTTLKLAAGAAAVNKYKVVLGMGGAGISEPTLKVVELRQKPITVQSYAAFDWQQSADTKFLLGTAGTTIVTELTKEGATNALPTTITANTDAETDAAKTLNITGWTAGEPADGSIVLTPVFSTAGLTVPETGVTVPTVTVNLTDTITITDWVIGTEEDPKFATYTVSASDAKNAETVAGELATARRARTEANADFQQGKNRSIAFTWALKDASQAEAFNAHTEGTYTFVGSKPTVVPDENVTLPEGVSLVISEDLTAAEKVTPEVNVLITAKEKVNITAVEMRDSNGTAVNVTNNVYTVAEDVENGTALAAITATLPNQFKVTATEPAVTIPDSLVFTAVEWLVYDESGNNAVTYNPSPDDATTYTLKPKTRRTSADRVDAEGGEEYNYVFSLGSQTPDFFPVVKFTVEGKVEITQLVAPAATLDAGTAGVDALADADAVIAALGTQIDIAEPANTGLKLPIAWTAPEGGYNAAVAGDYIFKGVVNTTEAPAGYKFASNLVTEFEVKVTVKSAAPAYKRGDSNNDSRINGLDLIPIQQYVKSQGKITPASPEGADSNGDGRINGLDLIPIQQYVKSQGKAGVLADR